MARKFVFDIETTPRPGIMDTFYPQWAESKYPGKEGQELEDMAALHAEFGMICAIAIGNALTDDAPKVYTAGSVEEEKELLKSVSDIFDSEGAILIGHNIKGFDIPFVAKRFMAHFGFVPRALNFGGKKPWEIPHIDTMELIRKANPSLVKNWNKHRIETSRAYYVGNRDKILASRKAYRERLKSLGKHERKCPDGKRRFLTDVEYIELYGSKGGV